MMVMNESIRRWLGGYILTALMFGQISQKSAGAIPSEAQAPPVVKAWGILFQVMDRLQEYVDTKALSSIHNDDILSSSAISILLDENTKRTSSSNDEAAVALLGFSRQVAALHAAGDAFDQLGSEAELRKLVSLFSDLQKFYSPELLEAARNLANRFCCPMHPEVTGKKNALCVKCGMPLDTFVRLSPFVLPEGARPAKIVKASVNTNEPLQVGVRTNARLYLTNLLGEPILATDLREVHTQKIHLLIVDESLSDYHHEHPEQNGKPGQYDFSFTSQKPGPYRVWADVQPYLTGLQEYAPARIEAATSSERLADTTEKLTAAANDLYYKLSFKSAPKTNEPVAGTLRIMKADGTPVTGLEPVMGAFSHLVAFHADGKTVLHIHPKTAHRLTNADRGGPELEFQFCAPKPGFFRLFAQVQIAGEQKFAPFGVIVQP
jgi:hypothetical protein